MFSSHIYQKNIVGKDTVNILTNLFDFI